MGLLDFLKRTASENIRKTKEFFGGIRKRLTGEKTKEEVVEAIERASKDAYSKVKTKLGERTKARRIAPPTKPIELTQQASQQNQTANITPALQQTSTVAQPKVKKSTARIEPAPKEEKGIVAKIKKVPQMLYTLSVSEEAAGTNIDPVKGSLVQTAAGFTYGFGEAVVGAVTFPYNLVTRPVETVKSVVTYPVEAARMVAEGEVPRLAGQVAGMYAVGKATDVAISKVPAAKRIGVKISEALDKAGIRKAQREYTIIEDYGAIHAIKYTPEGEIAVTKPLVRVRKSKVAPEIKSIQDSYGYLYAEKLVATDGKIRFEQPTKTARIVEGIIKPYGGRSLVESDTILFRRTGIYYDPRSEYVGAAKNILSDETLRSLIESRKPVKGAKEAVEIKGYVRFSYEEPKAPRPLTKKPSRMPPLQPSKSLEGAILESERIMSFEPPESFRLLFGDEGRTAPRVSDLTKTSDSSANVVRASRSIVKAVSRQSQQMKLVPKVTVIEKAIYKPVGINKVGGIFGYFAVSGITGASAEDIEMATTSAWLLGTRQSQALKQAIKQAQKQAQKQAHSYKQEQRSAQRKQQKQGKAAASVVAPVTVVRTITFGQASVRERAAARMLKPKAISGIPVVPKFPTISPFRRVSLSPSRRKHKKAAKRSRVEVVPFKYVPSLPAFMFGIRAKSKRVAKRVWSGLEVRPLIKVV